MEKYTVIIWILLISSTLYSQANTDFQDSRNIDKTIDSLQALLKKSKADSSKVIILYELASSYNLSIRNKEAIEVANSALLLSREIHFPRGECLALFILTIYELFKENYSISDENSRWIISIAKSNNYIHELGLGYYLQAFLDTKLKKYDEATEYCVKAKEIFLKLNNRISLARSVSLLATLYRLRNNYWEAIVNFSIAADIWKEFGYPVPEASVYDRLAQMFYQIGGYSYDVINYNNKALRLWKKTIYRNLEALQYLEIGNAYMDLNEDFLATLNLDSALSIGRRINDTITIANATNKIGEFFLKKAKYTHALRQFNTALALYQYHAPDDEGLPKCYFNLGDLNKYWGDSALRMGNAKAGYKKYAEAIKNYLIALESYKKINDRASQSSVSVSIGEVQTLLGNLTEADKYLNSGLISALRFGEKVTISLAYLFLYRLDSVRNDYKNAFHHIKLHQLYRDSLINIDILKKIESAKLREEFDKKEQQIALLDTESKLKTAIAVKQNQQKKFAYGIIAAVLLLSAFGFYRYRKHSRLKSEQKLLRERLLISQDLHDNVGSTLSSISVFSKVAQLQSDENKKEELQEVLEKINITSGDMMAEMNDTVWAINPRNDSMEKIIQRMESFAKPLLATRNISFMFDYGPSVLSVNLGMEKRKNFYLIFKEVVNNAYKYSGSSEIIAGIINTDKKLELIIKDNGVGFDLQHEMQENKLTLSGNGLRNMKMRAEEMKGKLQINSIAGEGTEVRISIPIP